MNMSNKNSLRRMMCILLSLTLCVAVSSGAAIIPYKRITVSSEMILAVGEPHDLGDGYSITVTKIDLGGDEATFELIKDRKTVDSTTVKSGEGFRLEYSPKNFYFKATLYAIFTGISMTRVQLTGCESGDTPDTTPPTVTEKSPTGENVPVATRIAITFSEPMNKESTEDAFSIYDSKEFRVVSGKFSWEGDMMIFTPSSDLDYDTQYSVRLYSGAMDLAYNTLVWDGWSFKTEPPNNPPGIPSRPSGPDSGYIGTSYNYSTTAKDPDGDDMKYVFDWGDDTTSETEFVKSGEIIVQSHAWNESGEYHIRVKAADDGGASSKWSESLMMVARTPELMSPTAAISAAPTEINEGERVSFSAEKSSDPDGDIISYEWDFGDGDAGAGVNVEHIYSRSGNHTATLTVTDNDNLSATDSVGIIIEPASVLSVSISTDSVSSGESGEVTVLLTSNGDPVQGAPVYLSATIGDINPDEGVTDDDGEFVSIFTAPTVEAETMYTIYAKAEIGDLAGEGSVSDMITVPIGTPPAAYMEIYPNPATEDESVTLEGWGEDEDGEVVECRWTLPDGTIISDHGDSSELALEPDEVVAGWYAFAVMDDGGIWSEEIGRELRILPSEGPTSTPLKINPFQRITDPVVVATIVALAAGTLLMLRRKTPVPKPDHNMNKNEDGDGSEDDKDDGRHGSILATSDPSDAVVFVDGVYKGRSPKTINNVLIGTHTVLFLKRGYFGYEKNAVVVTNQTTPVHRDLTKMPEVKLKLSAYPAEIVADGKSRSMIWIEIVTKDDNEIPIPVPEELTVVLETDIGTIESPVKIPRGRTSARSTLISSASSGTATVKAEAEYGKIVKLEGSTTVEFLDAESE